MKRKVGGGGVIVYQSYCSLVPLCKAHKYNIWIKDTNVARHPTASVNAV